LEDGSLGAKALRNRHCELKRWEEVVAWSNLFSPESLVRSRRSEVWVLRHDAEKAEQISIMQR